MNDKDLTPMMKQYYAEKEKVGSALLLFRMGDFYEMFDDDAERGSKALGIALTKRSGHPMCGVPHHAIDSYVPRLIEAGFHVAFCEQIEDAQIGRPGLVRRGVTEIISPATWHPQDLGEDNRFLVSLFPLKEEVFCSALDLTTGDFILWISAEDLCESLISSFHARFHIYEFVVNESARELYGTYKWGDRCSVTWVPDSYFDNSRAHHILCSRYRVVNLKGFGLPEDHYCAIGAAGAAILYAEEKMQRQVPQLLPIRTWKRHECLFLGEETIRNLDLLNHPYSGPSFSLLTIIRRTQTPMGGRFLRSMLLFPKNDEKRINEYLDGIRAFIKDEPSQEKAEKGLHGVGDVSRMCTRLSRGNIYPREVRLLSRSLEQVCDLFVNFVDEGAFSFILSGLKIDAVRHFIERVDHVIAEEPAASPQHGRIIREGHNTELDKVSSLHHNHREAVRKMEDHERKETGLTGLKIKYNRLLGYFIELSRSQAQRTIPQSYIHRQSLTGVSRFTTQALSDLYDEILRAESTVLRLQQQIYSTFLSECQDAIPAIQSMSEAIASFDYILAGARLAEELKLCRPTIYVDGPMVVEGGRHLIVESSQRKGRGHFIPNDLNLDKEKRVIVLTGPNMGGKSTYLRQNAHIAILAHMGYYVPAREALIPLLDQVFTRIGAYDNLANGESTFLMEMSEASSILHRATPRTLTIMDELGRGTSTYDGMGIAWAIVEHFAKQPELGYLLFSTHFHELSHLDELSSVKNAHVAVEKVEGKIVLSYRVKDGPSWQSFGLEVAQLAGMPEVVVSRALSIIQEFQKGVEPHTKRKKKMDRDDRGQILMT